MTKKKENSTSNLEVSAESLKERIRKYDRKGVLYLLKEGAMSQISEDDKVSVIQQIVMLRDMRLIDELAKSLEHFTVDMLDVDVNNRLNNDFVSDILDKYNKKFDLSDDTVCDEVFSLARTVGNAKLCATMMKKTSPSEDAIVDALFQAAIEKDAKTQITALDNAGYDVRTKNSAEMSAADLLRKRIENYTYPSGKKGIQMKLSDQNALVYLEDLAESKESAKKTRMTMLKVIAATVVVVAALSAGIVWYMNRDTSSDAAGADTTESTSTDATADTSADYAADTSLVVADGDTVNIDYTGYVDDVAFDGGSTNGAGAELTIGSGTYIDDFEDQLIGHNVGDEVEVNVTFPDDYSSTDLAGKDARFDVTINGIYE